MVGRQRPVGRGQRGGEDLGHVSWFVGRKIKKMCGRRPSAVSRPSKFKTAGTHNLTRTMRALAFLLLGLAAAAVEAIYPSDHWSFRYACVVL